MRPLTSSPTPVRLDRGGGAPRDAAFFEQPGGTGLFLCSEDATHNRPGGQYWLVAPQPTRPPDAEFAPLQSSGGGGGGGSGSSTNTNTNFTTAGGSGGVSIPGLGCESGGGVSGMAKIDRHSLTHSWLAHVSLQWQ